MKIIIKKGLKILLQIATGILFCFLLLAIYGKIQMIIFKQNYATFFGYTMFQVASASMEPALSINDVILVKTGDQFEVDDIISFVADDTIITHRVLSINGDSIVVKGDANNTIDSPIDRSAVIGRVTKVYKELKIWQDIFTDSKTLLFLFLTLLAFDFAFSYKKKENKKIKEKESKEKEIVEEPKEKIIKEKKIKTDDTIKIIQIKSEEKTTKDDSVKITQIQTEEQKVKDVIDSEELLALTQLIDLDEIYQILERESSTENLKSLQEELKNFEENDLDKIKETDIDEYTLRLDLKEIHNQIAKKIK